MAENVPQRAPNTIIPPVTNGSPQRAPDTIIPPVADVTRYTNDSQMTITPNANVEQRSVAQPTNRSYQSDGQVVIADGPLPEAIMPMPEGGELGISNESPYYYQEPTYIHPGNTTYIDPGNATYGYGAAPPQQIGKCSENQVYDKYVQKCISCRDPTSGPIILKDSTDDSAGNYMCNNIAISTYDKEGNTLSLTCDSGEKLVSIIPSMDPLRNAKQVDGICVIKFFGK